MRILNGVFILVSCFAFVFRFGEGMNMSETPLFEQLVREYAARGIRYEILVEPVLVNVPVRGLIHPRVQEDDTMSFGRQRGAQRSSTASFLAGVHSANPYRS